jgi:hypothetical protein
MSLYVPPDKLWILSLRSTQAFRERIQGVVRLWQKHAEARGDDAGAIDMAYVTRRILEAGVDQAFAEYD